MNKTLALILLWLPCVALGTPVPLDNIPGVNLVGVRLEMTKAELLAVRPQATSVTASGNTEQLGEMVPNGPTYWFEFRDGKLIHVLASPARTPASQQSQQTRAMLQALTTRFGAPTKINFGRQRRGAALQVAGAQFDLADEYSNTKVLLESNEVSMRVSVFKTDLEPPVKTTIPFAQMSNATQQQAAATATPAPAIRDFLNELLP
jgi:hypothetical protein